MARLAGLGGRVVVLAAEALDAQALVQHKVGGAGGAGQRSGALARLAVVVALLAAVRCLVVALGTLWVALAAGQLPPLGTLDALVAARPATGVTAQVALFATASVAVVPVEGAR